jgi:hypothetical protein
MLFVQMLTAGRTITIAVIVILTFTRWLTHYEFLQIGIVVPNVAALL